MLIDEFLTDKQTEKNYSSEPQKKELITLKFF
jgi:hypothetical protein